VALFLLGYALLTGGRPPVIRAVAMVGAVCGGIVLRLPVHPANTFALAWIVVALCSPSDLFTPGCQLSFLAVAVLCWGGALWQRPPSDALEKLAQESLPTWRRLLGRGLACVGVSFVVTLAVWLALAPLVAAHYHVVSPAAVLIGPAAVLLTSVALVAGFLLLGAAALGLPAWPLAWLTRLALGGCDALVDAADAWPGSYWYVTDLPAWWTWTFYLGLLAWLTLHPLRLRWRWAALAGLAWLCVGLSGSLLRAPRGEFRCTFLAVGHGGCAVLQTPDGRTFLYDAGSMGGPEVARRQIAPYLWHRGIRRIDEVFLSHADLDHYNGLLPLLDRFAVGQVSCTPSFGDRQSAASVLTLTALERRGVPVRVLCAGDRLEAGGVTFEVLHPPARGPEGNENARSLVLLVRHAGHSLLLTGDLEGEGLTCLLARQPIRVDVLMAPHHGGKSANTSALAKWAGPRVVVSSQAKPRGSWRADPVYEAAGGRFLSTWNDGAVAIRSGAEGLIVETYQSGQSWTVLPARAAH
jgi:competence protein ComEC